MEIIHQESIDLELVADLCAIGIQRGAPKPRDRSVYHVSNLLQSAKLIVKNDIRYHEYEGHPSGIMSMGRIFEAAVDCFLSDYAAKHGGFYTSDVESERDGIIASLDGVILLPEYGGMMVAETKLRFSQRLDIPFGHVQQISAYCHLMSTDLACYVSGHISSTPPTATAVLRILKLEKQRIAETWQGIVRTKKYLESQGCYPCPDVVARSADPTRCGAYAESWEALGFPEGWKGCSLTKGHSGPHRDESQRLCLMGE